MNHLWPPHLRHLLPTEQHDRPAPTRTRRITTFGEEVIDLDADNQDTTSAESAEQNRETA